MKTISHAIHHYNMWFYLLFCWSQKLINSTSWKDRKHDKDFLLSKSNEAQQFKDLTQLDVYICDVYSVIFWIVIFEFCYKFIMLSFYCYKIPNNLNWWVTNHWFAMGRNWIVPLDLNVPHSVITVKFGKVTYKCTEFWIYLNSDHQPVEN